MRTSIAVTALIAAVVTAGGCGDDKPKPDQVLPMPAPGTDNEGQLDPSIDNDPVSRFRGHLVWGHETRSFTGCGGEREGWVINDAGEELVEVYDELTSTPYQPMFVEVRGAWEVAPQEGFGAEYGEALRITELLRAENEGFGCRLDLDSASFIASGNEPSWRLQIRDDGISMRLMSSPDEIVFPAAQGHGQPPLITFDGSGPGGAIRITLEQRRCVDTMSGARFAWAATVDMDGRQLSGCAAEGL